MSNVYNNWTILPSIYLRIWSPKHLQSPFHFNSVSIHVQGWHQIGISNLNFCCIRTSIDCSFCWDLAVHFVGRETNGSSLNLILHIINCCRQSFIGLNSDKNVISVKIFIHFWLFLNQINWNLTAYSFLIILKNWKIHYKEHYNIGHIL